MPPTLLAAEPRPKPVPRFSFSLAELGPLMTPVLSEECRLRRCDECGASFRCDCGHHREPEAGSGA